MAEKPDCGRGDEHGRLHRRHDPGGAVSADKSCAGGQRHPAGKPRTLVHDMGCIETLARVDTLCVDKTGTITEPKMTVDDIIPLQPERYIADDIRMIMADYVCAMQDDNDTMAALRRYFTGQSMADGD